MATATARRTRITIDVSPRLRREIRVAAARHDVSVTRYLTEVLEQHLTNDQDKK